MDTESSLIESAESALDSLAVQEVSLVKEIETLFKGQVHHIRLIDDLRKSVPNTEKFNFDMNKLSTLVDSSSMLVEDVCSKIRQIDLAKARLESCLSRISDILDLGTCRNGVKQSMAAGNYEEAAMHIKRYLSIDLDQLHKTISIINCVDATKGLEDTFIEDHSQQKIASDSSVDYLVPDSASIESALQELDEARIRLLRLTHENFTAAISDDNSQDIERFFKIFPLLNEHSHGLQVYAELLSSKVMSPSLEESTKSPKMSQADKLAALYESIAKLIDSHQPLIETYYGPGHLMSVVKVIQKSCDRLSRKILEEFRNEKKLQFVAKVARNSSLQAVSQAPNYLNLIPSKLDPRKVDSILTEISLIISRSEVYLNFLIQRVKDDLKCKFEDEAQRQSSILELHNLFCIECELNHLVQELGGIYVMLEQFYMNESCKKAIMMDQVDADATNCILSSMLDDTFFIVKKCTKRAISTKSTEVFCAIINNSVAQLETMFFQVIQDRLKNNQYFSAITTKNLDLGQAYSAIQSGRYLQSARELELAKAQYFSALNNLERACDYIRTLRSLLDADVRKLRPSISVMEHSQEKQIEKAITCLNELSSLTKLFESLIDSSLCQLFKTTIKTRLDQELKTILCENPDLPSRLATKPDEIEHLSKNLLASFDKSLNIVLTSENYTKLVAVTRDCFHSTMKTLK